MQKRRLLGSLPALLVPMVLGPSLLNAQDGGSVRSDPPYVPASEHDGGAVPPLRFETATRPSGIDVLPWKPGGEFRAGAPSVMFRDPSVAPEGVIRTDVRIEVTQDMDRYDPAPYHVTPDVHVSSPGKAFRFSSVFDRTYEPRQDPEEPPPPLPPDWFEPGGEGVPWITGIGSAVKRKPSMEFELADTDVAFDRILDDGPIDGGGIEVDLWNGVARIGLAFLRGDVRTNPETVCFEPGPVEGGGFDGDGDGVPEGFGDGGFSEECFEVELAGEVSVVELDLFLNLVEGAVRPWDGVTLYASAGPAVSVEYVEIDFGESRTSWVFSGGLYAEVGVRVGGWDFFARGSVSRGRGTGDIDGARSTTAFVGVTTGF